MSLAARVSLWSLCCGDHKRHCAASLVADNSFGSCEFLRVFVLAQCYDMAHALMFTDTCFAARLILIQ